MVMRCRVHCALLAVTIGGAGPACSLTANLDHLSAGGAGSTEGAGASGTAASTGNAGEGGTGATPAGSGGGAVPSECAPTVAGLELLANGGIELGVAAQPPDGWYAFEATLTDETEYVHTGERAALVCSNSAIRDIFSAFADVPSTDPLGGGQVYVATACVRAHPEHPPPDSMLLILRENSGASSTDADSPLLLDLNDTWQKLEVTLTVSESATDSLNIIVAGATAPGNPCFIFDDAHVVRTK
jgi:hypothetical protein